MSDQYTITPANGGTRTVLMLDKKVKAVFIDTDHALFAAHVAGLLNANPSPDRCLIVNKRHRRCELVLGHDGKCSFSKGD